MSDREPERPRPLVVGAGNELRGDDAVGLLVARRVGDLCKGVDILEHVGEPVDLLDAWRGRELVLVIDAAATDEATIGFVHRFDAAADPLPAKLGGPSTHALGFADTVELGRALGRLPARLLVYGIEGRRFGLGAPPSSEVADAAERVAREIAELVHGTAAGRRDAARPHNGPQAGTSGPAAASA